MEVVIDQLNSLGTAEALTVATLEENMRSGDISNMVVMFLRILTSAEIQRRQDFFAPFILVRCRAYGFCLASLVPRCPAQAKSQHMESVLRGPPFSFILACVGVQSIQHPPPPPSFKDSN